MKQHGGDVLRPLTPGVFVEFDVRWQVAGDAQRVADLGDLDHAGGRYATAGVVRIDDRRISGFTVGLEDEAVGLEAHPSHGARWGHGRDAHRTPVRQRVYPEIVLAHRNQSAPPTDHLSYGDVGLRTRDQAAGRSAAP